MSYYSLAFAFSVASKVLELSPIVPQKKVRTARYFGEVFSIVPVLLFKISEYFTSKKSDNINEMLKTASLVNCRKVHRLKPMDKFDYALLLISWQVRLLFSRSIFKMRIEVTYFGQFYSPELQGNIQNNFAFLKKTSLCFENYSISL